LVERHKAKALVLSGGIGLNCVTNAALRRAFINTELSFFPACSDMGLPVGDALYGQWYLTGNMPKAKHRSMLLGRKYGEDEIDSALKRFPDTVPPGRLRLGELSFHESSDVLMEAANLLVDGKIIGWWQGSSEFGPRALGARSILANPRLSGVREILNERLKEREWFRPFGPSVLSKDSARYFPGGGNYPYMIEAPKVTDEGRQALENCVHVDGTARVQTVSSSDQPVFGQLLANVKMLTGHGALLNTSFNVREPIVESPADAVATFLRSRIDALVLDKFICFRR
jgi:carbamoyltransferase